jgi:hypothetical protein
VSQLTKLMLFLLLFAILLLLFAILGAEHELQVLEKNEPNQISTKDWKKSHKILLKFLSDYCYRR